MQVSVQSVSREGGTQTSRQSHELITAAAPISGPLKEAAADPSYKNWGPSAAHTTTTGQNPTTKDQFQGIQRYKDKALSSDFAERYEREINEAPGLRSPKKSVSSKSQRAKSVLGSPSQSQTLSGKIFNPEPYCIRGHAGVQLEATSSPEQQSETADHALAKGARGEALTGADSTPLKTTANRGENLEAAQPSTGSGPEASGQAQPAKLGNSIIMTAPAAEVTLRSGDTVVDPLDGQSIGGGRLSEPRDSPEQANQPGSPPQVVSPARSAETGEDKLA